MPDPVILALRRLLIILMGLISAVLGLVDLCQAESLSRDSVSQIAVADGQAEFDVVLPGTGSTALVIVSALSREAGPFPITLTTVSKPLSSAIPLSTESQRTRPAVIHPQTSQLALSPPSRNPPPQSRNFYLLIRDGDVASAENYLTVEARLAAVGKRVQVYIDLKDLNEVDHAALLEVVSTFDEQVFPLAARRFGPAEDVDGDGRFTIFLSNWLSRLAGGRVKVDGFVRGADFDVQLGEPFGNRCDMMYLNAGLRSGPHLKTVIAHEYTHAVRFSRKAFPRNKEGRLAEEEEGWLDEGLAHLVEDLHEFSRSNLDYRVSAFLSRPEKYRLVVEDYFSADLFRSHGNRGGTYLFLRWCVDQQGEAILDRMIRSPLLGIKNLEAATGRSFDELFREWTIALYLTGLDPETDSIEPGRFRSFDPRGSIEDWILAGPRSVSVKPDGPADSWSAVGTSAHYVLVHGSKTGAVHVKVAGQSQAKLQVTAVRLPENLGGLDLDLKSTTHPDGRLSVRAKVMSCGPVPIRLGAIAWEPLIPASDARASLFRRSGLDMLGIARKFGTSRLDVGNQLVSQPIPLQGVMQGDGRIVFKAVGLDQKGRRVAAWAEIENSPDERFEAADNVSR